MEHLTQVTADNWYAGIYPDGLESIINQNEMGYFIAQEQQEAIEDGYFVIDLESYFADWKNILKTYH